MRPIDYLLDRAALLLAFAGGTLLVLLVVGLGDVALRPGDALYGLLLAATLVAVVLVVDHRRQRAYRRDVTRQLARPAAAAQDLATLVGAKTREQRSLNRLLEHRHQRTADELRAYRERSATHRTFVDQWVHHMKTPLSVLELTVQEALRRGETPSHDLWESVAEELDAISEGMELMLGLSRLEGFEVDLRPARVDLASVARDAVNGLKRSWIRNGVFPRVEAPHAPVVVESDAKWLGVVLRQLLTNALKYSAVDAGGDPTDDGTEGPRPTVVVRVVAVADGARLTVTDSGIGIPEEDVPRVFERFFTGRNGRIGRASTGMGLFVAAEIAGRLGHEIALTSVPGRGTSVSLRFASRGVHRLGSGPTDDRDDRGDDRGDAETVEVTRSSPSTVRP